MEYDMVLVYAEFPVLNEKGWALEEHIDMGAVWKSEIARKKLVPDYPMAIFLY